MALSLTALEMKLSVFADLPRDEIGMLLSDRTRVLRAEEEYLGQSISHRHAFIIREGWVASFKVLEDGSRQVIDFHIPGDFLGLRTILLRTADHSFVPVTDALVSLISKQDLIGSFQKSPRLAAAVLWVASRDEAMMVEHLINVGRRNALTRTAHYLLELGSRMKLVGLGSSSGYDCPVTQYQLGDALGLSAIHVNRTLRKLREMGMLTFQDGRVTFDNYEDLVQLAKFDQIYLDQDAPVI
jgi:CRP-like cAMP-binding protein